MAGPGIEAVLSNADPEQLATELYDNPQHQQFPMEGDVALSEGDRGSAVWLRIKAILITRLEECRIENDKPLNEVETARLRGKIEAVQEFLWIGEDQSAEQDPDGPDLDY
jgi:hypothetical protein